MPPIGQIGKRLEIIKTAIALTDAETIAMQCSKLRVHKNDKLLDNILSVLDDENYIQATKLIDRYLHGPYDSQEEEAIEPEEEELPSELPAESVDEAALEEERRRRAREEEELIKKFGLFMEKAKQEEYNPIDEEEMMLMSQAAASENRPSEEEELTPPPKQPSTEEIMAQLNSIARDKIPESDIIGKSAQKHPEPEERRVETITPAEEAEEEEEFSFEIKETPVAGSAKTTTAQKSSIAADNKQSPAGEPEKKSEEKTESETAEPVETPESKPVTGEKEAATEYAPISYIDQKFRNMRNQYPQVEESSEQFESVEKLLYLISLEGYSEADIEKVIQQVYELKSEGKLAEAAQLLLIAAATESLFAQFVLARELYRGEILQKDLPEAFTQINRLALDDYPEAVCDLAQLYEYGIGIPKDKKRAFTLYEDALELGVERAERHLKRMEEESKGFLRKLFKK